MNRCVELLDIVNTLNEMANLEPEETGYPRQAWIGPAPHGPRVKFRDENQKTSVNNGRVRSLSLRLNHLRLHI